MLYTHTELIKIKYNSSYKIKNAVINKEIYKLGCGLYSDKERVSELEIITKKYNHAIFTSDSAYFYHGLTDNIPTKYYLATKKHSRKIKNDSIIQSFTENKFFEIGLSTINYNNIKIRIYDKERMLIELIRNKNTMSFDMYKEIINNYRKIIDNLDLLKLQKYLNYFENSNNILKSIQEEVL